MIEIKIGKVLIICGLLFWIAESICFGFNAVPPSPDEILCDRIASGVVFIGVVIYMAPAFKWYEYLLKK